MRKVLVGVVAIIGIARVASAQGVDPSQYDPQNWFLKSCPTCFVTGYVDVPFESTTVSRAELKLGNAEVQGWGFQCISGQTIDRIDAWVELADQTWKPLPQPAGALMAGVNPRPDVRLAFQALCPNVGVLTGFSLRLTNVPDLALGAHRFAFVLWHEPFHVTVIKTWNIVP